MKIIYFKKKTVYKHIEEFRDYFRKCFQVRVVEEDESEEEYLDLIRRFKPTLILTDNENFENKTDLPVYFVGEVENQERHNFKKIFLFHNITFLKRNEILVPKLEYRSHLDLKYPEIIKKQKVQTQAHFIFQKLKEFEMEEVVKSSYSEVMRICIVGYHENQKLYDNIAINYPNAIIISHNPKIKHEVLKVIQIENIGLEFHAYDYYIKNIWKDESVLFMHDDLGLKSFQVMQDIEDECFDKTLDQAYIFNSMRECEINGSKHGRMIYCSNRYIEHILNFPCSCEKCLKIFKAPHVGMFYDINNTGYTGGKRPEGVLDFNDAISHFHSHMGRIRNTTELNCYNRLIFPDIIPGKRGELEYVK